MKKVHDDAAAALAGLLRDDMTIVAGGFGLCGIPENLIDAIVASGVKGLTVVSNNCGVDDWGLGKLLDRRMIKKMISSYVGENKEFARQYLAGEVEVEFNPQGTLAERIRAGGAGIPAFFTQTGVGTLIAEGKEGARVRRRDLHHGARDRRRPGDRQGVEGRSRGQSRLSQDGAELQPDGGDRGRVCVAEVEQLVPNGEIDPDHIHTPGIFVDRIILGTNYEKRIEQRTVRKRAA